MAIFSRRSGTELPSESQVEYSNRSGRRWPVLVMYIVAALLVATAVVFAGRWIYDTTSNNSDNTSVSTKQGIKSTNPSPQAPAQTAAPNSSSGKAGTTPPPSSSASGNNRPASPPAGNLPNNGPGEVVALFIGTSLVAAVLHYAFTLKRSVE
jgi:hypothetical protein